MKSGVKRRIWMKEHTHTQMGAKSHRVLSSVVKRGVSRGYSNWHYFYTTNTIDDTMGQREDSGLATIRMLGSRKVDRYHM